MGRPAPASARHRSSPSCPPASSLPLPTPPRSASLSEVVSASASLLPLLSNYLPVVSPTEALTIGPSLLLSPLTPQFPPTQTPVSPPLPSGICSSRSPTQTELSVPHFRITLPLRSPPLPSRTVPSTQGPWGQHPFARPPARRPCLHPAPLSSPGDSHSHRAAHSPGCVPSVYLPGLPRLFTPQPAHLPRSAY